MPQARPVPGKTLLTPARIPIDHPSQMAIATTLVDAVVLRDHAASAAAVASGSGVFTILAMAAEKAFSGRIGGAGPEGIPGLAWLLLLCVPSRR